LVTSALVNSELRLDPLSGSSTILAPHRQGRPRDRARLTNPSRPQERARHDPNCPFCPGGSSERATPILVLPDLEAGGWRARIVANAFPALWPAGARPMERAGAAEPALGHHEVVIETPRHDRDLTDMTPHEFRAVIEITFARMRQLTRDPEVAALFSFRNHGAGAGSSLVHGHGQIMALPFVPSEMARREAFLAQAHAETGRNPFEAALAAERADGRRIVAENGLYAAYVPHAPEAPCEMRVQPLRWSADPFDIDPWEIGPLSDLLRDCLTRLRERAADPSYNLIWWIMSRRSRRKPFAGWCVRVRPRTVPGGGFEKASGVAILSSTPEADAARLRGDAKEV
jgi:UDPglucose--hexose-1-phosphate uridylyltransferase